MKASSSSRSPVVFLFDVDNTLLDNDRVIEDLRRYLVRTVGAQCTDQYFAIFERWRQELGYADYLGALQRYREAHPRDLRPLAVSRFLLGYPFADRLFPSALDVLERFSAFGPTVILSDGDVVFQPLKVERSGLAAAVQGRILIYIHKERELEEIERLHPAEHYVFVDDKVRLLTAFKRAWGERITTVFPRQGHYAREVVMSDYPRPDVTVDRIGDLLGYDPPALLDAARPAANRP